MNGERFLPVTLFLAFGVVAWKHSRIGNWPPPPSAFIGAALAFTVLGVVGAASPGLAAALGAAVVLGFAVMPVQTVAGAGHPTGLGGGTGGGVTP